MRIAYSRSEAFADAGQEEEESGLIGEIRWLTGEVNEGPNNQTTADALRDADNDLPGHDNRSGGWNCTGDAFGNQGWWDRLAVVDPDHALLIDNGADLYPYTSRVFVSKRHREGCGHQVWENLFPLPGAGGVIWAWTYDFMMIGDASYTGHHPHCLNPIGVPGAAIQVIHGGYEITLQGLTYRFAMDFSAPGWPDFGPSAHIQGKSSASTHIQLNNGTWYRMQMLMPWDNATEFRLIPRIHRLPADGGASVVSINQWFQRDGSTNMTTWFAADPGNRCERPAGTTNMNAIRHFSFGDGQSTGAVQPNDNGPLLMWCVAGARFATVASETDFLAGISD